MALKKNLKKERGVSLLLTVVILSLVLAISIGIFDVVWTELILSGNIRSSTFALYAADEALERTAYIDRILGSVCSTMEENCFVSPLEPASNGACGQVSVSKIISTGFTEITAVGQYPGGDPCVTDSPSLVKRSFFFQYPMPELEALAAWWRFDNESGQFVFDTTQNNNDGTLGPTSGVDLQDPARQNTIPQTVFGGAVQFSSVEDDFIAFPDSISTGISWPVSITAWVCSKNTPGMKTLVRKGGTTNTESFAFFLWQPAAADASLHFQFKDAAGAVFGATSTIASVVEQNKWTHVAVTYDGSQARFYKNGAIVGTSIFIGKDSAPSAAGVFLGIDISDIGNRNFNGILDEVKIFNKTLQDGSGGAPNDILREYESIKPPGNPGDAAWQC